MRALIGTVVLSACVSFASAVQGQLATQEATLYDEDVQAVSFEAMTYPTIPLNARVQGTVVVQATLDGNGNVIAASPLTGPPLLHPETLANVRQWKFAPTLARRAIVVYDFIQDKTCFDQDLRLFRLPHRNLATITACIRTANF
jgi:hypothetical protein